MTDHSGKAVAFWPEICIIRKQLYFYLGCILKVENLVYFYKHSWILRESALKSTKDSCGYLP